MENELALLRSNFEVIWPFKIKLSDPIKLTDNYWVVIKISFHGEFLEIVDDDYMRSRMLLDYFRLRDQKGLYDRLQWCDE